MAHIISVRIWLIAIIVILIIVVWVTNKMKVAEDITLLQVSLADMTPDLLLEKNPIIITDNVVSCKQVIDSVFAWGYIWSKHVTVSESSQYNPYQYLLVHCNTSKSSSVVITHPRQPKGPVEVKLYQGNILILPWSWKFQLKKNGNTNDNSGKVNSRVKCIGLHTLSSFAYGALGGVGAPE